MVILETAYKSSLQEIEKWRGKMNKYKKNNCQNACSWHGIKPGNAGVCK